MAYISFSLSCSEGSKMAESSPMLVNLGYPVFQFLPEKQIAFDPRLRQEIESIDRLMVAADAIDASEPLNQPHGVPVEVVIDDLVTVLKVETFGEHVGGDDCSNSG